MNEFFEKTFYENTLGQWTIAVLIVLGSVVLSRVIFWIITRFAARFIKNTKTSFDDIILNKLKEPVLFAVIIVGIWYALGYLNFSPSFDELIGKAY